MPTLEELAAAEEATEETTTEEEVAETEETEEAETTEESSEEEETAEEDDPDAAFFEALAETGQDWRAKYGSREAAIQGMQHLMSRVGRKEAEEQIGQALLEKLGEEGVRKILYGQNGDDKPDKPDEDDLPASWNEMLAAQRILESDQASPSEKEQARKQLTAFQRSVHETVQTRATVLKEIEALKKQLAEFRQTSTETAEQAAVREWDAINGKDVYTADKKLTPLGQKVNDLLLNDEVIQKLPNEVDRRNMALRLARASQPKAKPHRKVHRDGKHQRATGRQDDDLRTEEERMKHDLENMTEEEYLKAWVFRE